MKWIDFLGLLALAGLWGASFLFIRVAVPVLGPTLLVELRVFIAALSLMLYALVIRKRVDILSKWKPYLILGLINAAIPFTFISVAELQLSAALAAILNATTPMFTALVARVFLSEKLNVMKFIGLILGIFGVMVGVGGASGFQHSNAFGWALCSLAAALAYAFGGVYSSRTFKSEPPIHLAIGQQLAAGIWILPFAFIHPVKFPLHASVVFSVLALAILSTGLAYLIYFRLMSRIGPVKTMSVTFLVPIFGLVWGFLFLHEALTWHLLLSLIIILASVGFISNPQLRKMVKHDGNA